MTECDSILLVSTRLGEKSPLGFQTLENGPFEGGVDIPKLKLTWNRLIGWRIKNNRALHTLLILSTLHTFRRNAVCYVNDDY